MELIIPRKVDAQYLDCYIRPRYWEDSDFNSQKDDKKGTLAHDILKHNIVDSEIMRRLGVSKEYSDGFIRITIDLTSGFILDWPEGNTASFHYKSCDENVFVLTDQENNFIYRTPECFGTEYVIGPKFMNDFGDYFVLKVNKDGTIKNWNSEAMKESLQEWTNNNPE